MKEIWKNINGYENLYQVSNLGNIKSFKKCSKLRSKSEIMLKTNTIHPSGYFFVTLIKDKIRKSFSIHRLVANAFIDNINNYPQINHIDGIKSNNCDSNLEWCDNMYNAHHAIKMGLINYRMGENHGMSKLKEKDVIKIREMYSLGVNKNEISKIFNITPKYAYTIYKRKTWKYLN
jgi:hypothetical protein